MVGSVYFAESCRLCDLDVGGAVWHSCRRGGKKRSFITRSGKYRADYLRRADKEVFVARAYHLLHG